MNIIFCWLNDKSKIKLILGDSDFNLLLPVFNELEKKSGLFIDPYSDTRLSPDHAKAMLSIINRQAIKSSKNIEALKQMLEISSARSEWILILGD